MYLAASQRYQPNKPGHCPSSASLYQIPRCMSASAGRVPILKFHSDRGENGTKGAGMRENLRSKRFIRIAGLFEPSSSGDPSFSPIFALILDDLVCRVPDGGSIVRFNGLFFHHSWIYYGRLEESIVSCIRGCFAKFCGKFK